MPKGKLQITLKSANKAFPVNNTFIQIKDDFGQELFSEEIGWGKEGLSKVYEISAPDREESLVPSENIPYSTCTVTVTNPEFCTYQVTGVQIFDGITSILNIDMLPRDSARDSRMIYYDIPKYVVSDRFPTDPSSIPPEDARIQNKVYIPEFVTVHLGTPSSSAQNVTVPFIDYIKNVASSEIYPTWPRESLRANILCQISLVLNRIYTDWYISKGYNYTITNSTAYDQYFVYGRNIFDSISEVVDEIFNIYIRKPNRIEPFYAEYCNGTTVTCPGLSQWGTVGLANDGYGAKEILEYYYGSVNLIETNDIRAIESSYRGVPLRLGSSGNDVLTIQNQLNRIAINYPSINVVDPDGIFGQATEEAVKTFQRLFLQTSDGIVGKNTWYKISYIYSAVKKLAELTSEGERPPYVQSPYPGYILRNGSKGVYVQELQFYLQKIALYNQYVSSVKPDGFFGNDTRRSVLEFQRFYGLSEDGLVGKITWDKIIEIYRATINVSPDVPVPEYPIRDYPGYLIKSGQQGDNVTYVQNLLNAVSSVFAGIPLLNVDGKFGPATKNAVTVFQRDFGLSADGIIGKNTWNKLNQVYISVLDGCIFDELPPSAKTYPGTLVKMGQRSENVRYIQRRLNIAGRVIKTIPRISEDGIFGQGTKNAVIAFQNVFGLSPDGIVGQSTWATLNFISFAVESGCLSQNQSSFSEDDSVAVNAPAATSTFSGQSLRFGFRSEDVKALKKKLCELGFLSENVASKDNFFGLATKNAVTEFQKKSGIDKTGVVNKETWDMIFSIGQ